MFLPPPGVAVPAGGGAPILNKEPPLPAGVEGAPPKPPKPPPVWGKALLGVAGDAGWLEPNEKGLAD